MYQRVQHFFSKPASQQAEGNVGLQPQWGTQTTTRGREWNRADVSYENANYFTDAAHLSPTPYPFCAHIGVLTLEPVTIQFALAGGSLNKP